MSMFLSLSLFFLSFAPLWVSVLFIEIKSLFENTTNIWVENIVILCIVYFGMLSLGILRSKLEYKTKEGTNSYALVHVKEQKNITTEYLLSYILPLFTFDFKTWGGVVLFLIFFITMGFLCIRHNYFSVNIVLEILGYRYYECILKNDDGINVTYSVISRRNLMLCLGEDIYLNSLNNEYKLDVE